MTPVLTPKQLLLSAVGLLVLNLISRSLFVKKTRATKLRGPPSSGTLAEVKKIGNERTDEEPYEEWAAQYGKVYHAPGLGSKNVILCDPKAIAHFYATEGTSYIRSPRNARGMKSLFGNGLFVAEGDDHKRQRRSMTPAFSNASVRQFTQIFFESGYKLKDAWDNILASSPKEQAIIEVQLWMNCVSLDSIGVAGLSHDFGALKGHHSDVADVLESFSTTKFSFATDFIFGLSSIIPLFKIFPNARKAQRQKLYGSMGVIAEDLAQRTSQEKKMTGDFKYSPGQSVIGALIKAENNTGDLRMSHDEVVSQMNVLMIAGYETTSISLTWALYELARHPDVQEKLRKELQEFSTTDPTYDQFTNGLHYLNAVTREVLRLRPPVAKTQRMASLILNSPSHPLILIRILLCGLHSAMKAAHDDIVQLSYPLLTEDGKQVNEVVIAKGTSVIVPIATMNRSSEYWGEDAKEFKPERWLDEAGISAKTKEIQGFSHLLTFGDGARMCLGKAFAIAEFKAVLTVIIRNYRVELKDGSNTSVKTHRALLSRPAMVGENGARMPLQISKVQ